MLYYETLSVLPMLQFNQLHTTIARLPEDLARRVMRAQDQYNQAQRTCAYVLLEKMIRKYANEPRGEVTDIIKPEFSAFFNPTSPLSLLHYDAYGKPYFSGVDHATLSVSHAANLVACALVLEDGEKTASPVGIDVQNVEYEQERAERIAQRYFSEGERLLLAPFAADTQEFCRTFTRIWTRKEAYLKYLGVGMSGIGKADTTSPRLGCRFVETEELLSYRDFNDRNREELYYITVCTDETDETV